MLWSLSACLNTLQLLSAFSQWETHIANRSHIASTASSANTSKAMTTASQQQCCCFQWQANRPCLNIGSLQAHSLSFIASTVYITQHLSSTCPFGFASSLDPIVRIENWSTQIANGNKGMHWPSTADSQTRNSLIHKAFTTYTKITKNPLQDCVNVLAFVSVWCLHQTTKTTLMRDSQTL